MGLTEEAGDEGAEGVESDRWKIQSMNACLAGLQPWRQNSTAVACRWLPSMKNFARPLQALVLQASWQHSPTISALPWLGLGELGPESGGSTFS